MQDPDTSQGLFYLPLKMKTFFRNIHLYLGLSAGLVIMVTCFTGATLVFEKELQSYFYPERYYVDEVGERVSIAKLTEQLAAHVPQATVTSIKVHDAPERTTEITYHEPTMAEGVSAQAFMNPYTGELIGLYTHRNSFFFTMFSLHRWLLAGDTGKLIVGISTSIFLFILITGIVLWWPASKKKLKQRVKLKLSGGWKRINHDLHIVIGFYTAIFLFVFAFTGLAWSFQWFNNGIYWITGTENKRPDPPASVYEDGTPVSFDVVDSLITNSVADIAYYSMNTPRDSSAAYTVSVMTRHPSHEKASDQYFVDQYTGKFIGSNLYRERNLGQRTRSAFYAFHVGSVAGMPGRIIAFVACLAGVFFPVTGVILWINRLNKEKRKKRKQAKLAIPELE
jgi:uncharacterized iron-regulated membrane protein